MKLPTTCTKRKVKASFVDERGAITNVLEGIPVEGVSIITSKKNSVRSNHFHKVDWHFLYVIVGKMIYYERSADPNDTKLHLKTQIIEQGEMVFTPPNRVHRVEFLEDTVLLCLSKLPKDKSRHDMIKEEW